MRVAPSRSSPVLRPDRHMAAPLDRSTEVSLDERWIEFSAATAEVFERFPQAEPLRPVVFKELSVRRRARTLTDRIKHWTRPLRQREFTVGRLDHADFLFVLESDREVIHQALLPVHRKLREQGVISRALAVGRRTGLDDPEALIFQFQQALSTPRWAKQAWPIFREAWPELRDESLTESFLAAAAIEEGALRETHRVLDSVRPKVVVIASSSLAAGARFAGAARQKGITSVLMQHGITQPFYVPVHAEHVFAWGETSSDNLKRLGAEAIFHLTGSPRHDSMGLGDHGVARKRFLHSLGLPDRPTLVFFSNGNDLTRNGCGPEEAASWLEDAGEAYGEAVNIVVRLHPREDGALYRCSKGLTVTKAEVSYEDTLAAADVTSSICSTALYDGLLYRKPVRQLHADHWPELADNWRDGLAARIATRDELLDSVAALSNGGGTGAVHSPVDEDTVSRVFLNHGTATEVAAARMLDLLKATG
jgi:hypothetical protein